MKTIKITFLLLTITNANSYNSRKCMESTRGNFWFGGLFSTTSFITSTGDCALIGSIQQKKETYIATNLYDLKADSARGTP